MNEIIVAMMQAGKWEDSIQACQSVLVSQPTNGKIHACMGESYYQLGRFRDAEPSFKRAYILDPSLWRAAVRHAQCLEKLHRYRDSMDVVKDWLRIKPGNTDLLGLQEFLETQPESQEHDGWERTRRIGVTIVNAGFGREEAASVPRQYAEAEAQAAADEEAAASTPQAWPAGIKLRQTPGIG